MAGVRSLLASDDYKDEITGILKYLKVINATYTQQQQQQQQQQQ